MVPTIPNTTMTADQETEEEVPVVRQPHLKAQDASTVDPTKLTALTPEVVSGSTVPSDTSVAMHL